MKRYSLVYVPFGLRLECDGKDAYFQGDDAVILENEWDDALDTDVVGDLYAELLS
jgi:hypothetical protein